MKIKSNLPVLMAMHDPPLKQSDVAKASSISPTTINQLYQNKLKRLPIDLCERLYDVYGWTPGDIWTIKKRSFKQSNDHLNQHGEA